MLALNLISFLCSIQGKLEIQRMHISECKSKYCSCLLSEIIWVCEVGLRFPSLAGFSGRTVCWVQCSPCGWILGLQGNSHHGHVSASGHFPQQPERSAHPARFCTLIVSLILLDLPQLATPCPQYQGKPLLTTSCFLSFGWGDWHCFWVSALWC